MLLCMTVANLTNTVRIRKCVKAEYWKNNQIIVEVGVVLSNGNTAPFSSTLLYIIFCDFAFSITKEQNSTQPRAPPCDLNFTNFKLNGGFRLSIYFIEDKNGDFFSTDRKRRFIRLTGREAYNYLRSEKGRGRRFFRTSTEEDNGEKIFVEVPREKQRKIRKSERHDQYVSDCEKLFEGQIISMYDTEILDEELTIEEAEMTDGTSVEDTVINNMDIEALHTAIQSLTKEEFAILNMLYFSERKISETAIAELLSVSVSAVSQRKKSIIKKLKKFFEN